MPDRGERIATAARLIEQALEVLDEAPGEENAACLLQHGLDTLLRVPAMQEGDEIDPALLAQFGYGPEPADAITHRLDEMRRVRN